MALPEGLTTSSPTTRRADLVTGSLHTGGVGHWFIAPGSRSTPLVLSIARRGVPHHVLIDERVAGFCAVGAARVGVTAAIITTSGTAVANLLPACCEADADELGWVACTADRPHRDVALGANQTLGQEALLAGPCRRVADLDTPTLDGNDDDDATTRLADVISHLRGTGRGPVHVNVRLDKPLEPPAGWHTAVAAAPVLLNDRGTNDDVSDLAAALAMDDGLVVCGSLPAGERPAVEGFLARLGWPVVADVTSGLVVPPSVPRLPTVALRSSAVREALTPKQVLWLGGLLTEDAVALWLRARRVPVVQVQTGQRRRDPFELASHTLVVSSMATLTRALPSTPGTSMVLADQVRRLSSSLSSLTALVLAGPISEPAVASLVLSSARAGDVVFVGNSMPVRDADRFAIVPADVTVISNRGVSGIDGCIATGLGAALASGRPTTVFIGDLAFLHDLSGAAAVAQARARVRVVVVNNGGGGIFSFLPVAGGTVDPEQVERYFGTPHSLALAPMALALGLQSTVCADVDALQAALAQPVTGPAFIEVRTTRQDNVACHRRLDAAVEALCLEALTSGRP
jgi:2-succinyl-5-enolpyruvyl-6-hydroxy-3-cyclohexene-1-carboxylate synthase